MIGRLPTGKRGLGQVEVRGRKRVPKPPARMMAFTVEMSCALEVVQPDRRIDVTKRRVGQKEYNAKELAAE